jgi:hypothetical protein
MNRLRARLLTSLVLVALVTASLGVGKTWAGGPRQWRDTPPVVEPIQGHAGPMSGEPDSGGQGKPLTTPHSISPVVGVNPWLQQLWYRLWTEWQARAAGRHW